MNPNNISKLYINYFLQTNIVYMFLTHPVFYFILFYLKRHLVVTGSAANSRIHVEHIYYFSKCPKMFSKI